MVEILILRKVFLVLFQIVLREIDFLTGFMKDTRPWRDQSPVPVVIWRGKDGNNIHCTTNLDINSWATAKS